MPSVAICALVGDPWGDRVAAVLAEQLLVQRRRRHSLVPLAPLRDRKRSGSYVAVLLHMQQVLHFDSVLGELASLPVSVGTVLSAGVSTKLSNGCRDAANASR